MSIFTRPFVRLFGGLLVTSMVAIGAAVPAFADTTTLPTQLIVTASTLNWTANPPTLGGFTGVTLNGANQITTATVNAFDVVDGDWQWRWLACHCRRTPLTDINGTKVITGSTLTISKPSITPGLGSFATPNQLASMVAADAHEINTTPYKIASAPRDEGMGMYTFGATTIKVTIPANAYAHTYQSDVTFTLATAP